MYLFPSLCVHLCLCLCPSLSLCLCLSLSFTDSLSHQLASTCVQLFPIPLSKLIPFLALTLKKILVYMHVCQQVMVQYKVSSKSGKLFLFQPSFICIMPDSSITFCATLVYWSTENHSTISWPRAWSWVSRSVLSQLENTSGKSKLTFQVPSTVYALFT